MYHNFRHGCPQSSMDIVFLNRNDGLRFGGCFPNRLHIQRFQSVHIDHPGMNPFSFQEQSRVQGDANHLPGCNNGNIVSFHQEIGFPDLKRNVVPGIDIRHRHPSHTDIDRALRFRQYFCHFPGLMNITWQQNGNSRNGTQHGNIVKGVMGGAQRSIADPPADSYYLYIDVAVYHIHLHLLQTAGGQKTSGPADKGLFSAGCQSGSDPDSILLSNSHFHKLPRTFLRKASQHYGSPGIGGHGNDVPILFCTFQQGIRKRFPAWYWYCICHFLPHLPDLRLKFFPYLFHL